MKGLPLFMLAGMFLASCSGPTRTTPTRQRVETPKSAPEAGSFQAATPAKPLPLTGPPAPSSQSPEIARHPLHVQMVSQNGIDLTIVSFDRRDYFLKVVDQKGGPGSLYGDAREAARAVDGIAAINGGFFTPEGAPVGLAITGGERRGSFNSSSSIGSGILDGARVTIANRDRYQPSSELLQSGPRLVWQGERLVGLSSGNPRPRSFLLWDGGEHFALGFADSASLQGLSQTLQSQPFSGFTINYALNLDGGTSCDLWVSGSVPGGEVRKSSFFRKKARNYLVLRDR